MKTSQAEIREAAIRTVHERAQSLSFFHDERRIAYATIPVANHGETWPVRSRDFRLWVMRVLYETLGAAPKTLVTRVLDEFEVHAICRGPMHLVHVRTAELDGAFYIDLGNDQWQVVEVTANGWRVLDDSPVKFRRPVGMTALPVPRDGCNIRDLRGFLNDSVSGMPASSIS